MTTFSKIFDKLDIDELTKYDIAVTMWNAALESVVDIITNNTYIGGPAEPSNQMEFALYGDKQP